MLIVWRALRTQILAAAPQTIVQCYHLIPLQFCLHYLLLFESVCIHSVTVKSVSYCRIKEYQKIFYQFDMPLLFEYHRSLNIEYSNTQWQPNESISPHINYLMVPFFAIDWSVLHVSFSLSLMQLFKPMMKLQLLPNLIFIWLHSQLQIQLKKVIWKRTRPAIDCSVLRFLFTVIITFVRYYRMWCLNQQW